VGVINLYRVKLVAVLAKKLKKLWIRAPQVAKNAQAGRFAILRIDEHGGRFPLSFSAGKGSGPISSSWLSEKIADNMVSPGEGTVSVTRCSLSGSPVKIAKSGARAVRGGEWE
jgi:hypothetical protein